MRKMTKTAVTLAAMSAMTVASASMALADAKQEANISSIAKAEEAVDTEASGEWGGNDATGWTFTKTDGTKLKDQWAQIDGAWYYFDGDKVVQDGFREIDNKGYFFDEVGRLSTGWRKINSETDAYSDLAKAIEVVEDKTNKATMIDDTRYEYGYRDHVWVYSDESGVSKSNEWFQDYTGLWYYFDENVMVRNVYDYNVTPDNMDAANSSADRYYGFDENGAMLVGWNSKKVSNATWNNPTSDGDGKTWYFYADNGQMQKQGWKQINGKWYLFANLNADDAKVGVGGFPLIVNSFVRSAPKTYSETDPNDIRAYEYFYVNGKGELVSGITEIEDFYKVTFYQKDKTINVGYDVIKDENKYVVNFSAAGFAAKEGVEGKRYYLIDPEYKKAVYTDADPDDATDAIEKISTYVYKTDMTIESTVKKIVGASNLEDRSQALSIAEIDESYSADSLMLNVLSGKNGKWEDNGAADSIVTKWDYSTPTAVDEKKTYKDNQTEYKRLEQNNKDAEKDVVEKVSNYKAAVEKINRTPVIDIDADFANDLIAAVSGNTAISSDVDKNIKEIITAIQTSGNCTVGIVPVENITTVSVSGNSNAVLKGNITVLLGAGNNIYAVEDQLLRRYNGLKDSYDASNGILPEADRKKLSNDMDAIKKSLDKVTALRIKAEYAYARNLLTAGQDTDYQAYMDYLDKRDKLEKAEAKRVAAENALKAYNGKVTSTASDFEVRGSYVANGIVVCDNGDLYAADKDGELLIGKALEFGLGEDDASIEYKGGKYRHAYIIFGNDGKALRGYNAGEKTVVLGGISYWSSSEEVRNENGIEVATVFVSSRAK